MTVRRQYALDVQEVDQGWWPWGVTMEVRVVLAGQHLRSGRVWGRTKPHALRAAIRWGRHLAEHHHKLHGYARSVTYTPRGRT